jgi:hypothetical protein
MDMSEYDDGSPDGKSSDGTGKTNIGIFVVYFDEKNE